MLTNKLLFLGSIGFMPLVLAQNDCTSRLISCFAFSTSGVFDYELVYDQIPDGSISSICQSTIKKFKSSGLGTPGCQKLNQGNSDFNVPATSNLVAFSTRVGGSPNFDPLTQAFAGVLECSINQVASCSTVTPPSGSSRHRMIKKQAPADLLANGGLMSQVGNQLEIVGNDGFVGTLTLEAIDTQPADFPAITASNDIAIAIQQTAKSVILALAKGTTAIEPFEAPIGTTQQALKVVIDPAIGTLNQDQAAQFSPSDWQVLIAGLIDNLASNFTGFAAGTYSLTDTTSSLDLFISATVAIPQQ